MNAMMAGYAASVEVRIAPDPALEMEKGIRGRIAVSVAKISGHADVLSPGAGIAAPVAERPKRS